MDRSKRSVALTVATICVLTVVVAAVYAHARDAPALAAPEQIFAEEGKLTLLRVHDVGTGFGPPSDFIDVEVVIRLDSQPERAFGFQLRADADEAARRAMLDLLRTAFNENKTVRVDYVSTGGSNSTLIRTMILPSYELYLPAVSR
jgi:hypothetical protein